MEGGEGGALDNTGIILHSCWIQKHKKQLKHMPSQHKKTPNILVDRAFRVWLHNPSVVILIPFKVAAGVSEGRAGDSPVG